MLLRYVRTIETHLLAVVVMGLTGPALGNTKNVSAPHAAPAHMSAFGGASRTGGVHMPGGMGGGAHMAGGAHIPGSMGGAHMSGSMGGAHMPSSMAGGAHFAGQAHMPGSMGEHARAASASSAHAAGTREAASRGEGTHTAHEARQDKSGAREAAGHGTGTHETRVAGAEHDARATHADPRIGGSAALHTRGIAAGAGAAMAMRGEHGAGEAGRATHMDAREVPRPDPHRDIARDHAFVAAHAADFHTRLVSGFTAREFGLWRAGYWASGWRYGRFGWWWAVGDVWYPYLNPVFPYPLVVAPLVAYDTDVVEGPALQFHALPPGIPPLPATPAGQFTCANPAGAFPAVSVCNGPWTLAQNTQDQNPQAQNPQDGTVQ